MLTKCNDSVSGRAEIAVVKLGTSYMQMKSLQNLVCPKNQFGCKWNFYGSVKTFRFLEYTEGNNFPSTPNPTTPLIINELLKT